MVLEEDLEMPLDGGVCDVVLYRPEGKEQYPGVLHLTDIGGIRTAHRDMARRVAAEGYAVMMPNVFYRNGRPPMFNFERTPGDERTMKRFAELAGSLTPEAMESDARVYVDFLSQRDFVSEGAMGVVGYCFTGAMALRTAAVRPDRIKAAASLHGGGLYTDAPTSPHHVLPQVQARLYFGHATNDRMMPAEAIEKFETALKAWGGTYESEIYEGAFHSWTVPDSPVYNQSQAERAFAKLTEVLGTLK